MATVDASIVIRTYNEAKYLAEALEAVARQDLGGRTLEVVVVDSGSTDRTLEIAAEHGARLVRIDKADFTFGRSLNMGCAAARGRALAFISGHCVPVGTGWLAALVAPLEEGRADYVYGRQVGRRGVTKFSEEQLFRRYFGPESRIPQADFFCNNANAAITAAAWARFGFDEELTGLEDMALARRMIAEGLRIGYVAEAAVEHLHEESWRRVRIRYEREAFALQRIAPEAAHVGLRDVARYVAAGCAADVAAAWRARRLPGALGEIALFRICQYWGAWRGANEHRRLSRAMKDRYFYPVPPKSQDLHEPYPDRRAVADESA